MKGLTLKNGKIGPWKDGEPILFGGGACSDKPACKIKEANQMKLYNRTYVNGKRRYVPVQPSKGMNLCEYPDVTYIQDSALLTENHDLSEKLRKANNEIRKAGVTIVKLEILSLAASLVALWGWFGR